MTACSVVRWRQLESAATRGGSPAERSAPLALTALTRGRASNSASRKVRGRGAALARWRPQESACSSCFDPLPLAAQLGALAGGEGPPQMRWRSRARCRRRAWSSPGNGSGRGTRRRSASLAPSIRLRPGTRRQGPLGCIACLAWMADVPRETGLRVGDLRRVGSLVASWVGDRQWPARCSAMAVSMAMSSCFEVCRTFR
jgi:hypothetical protein